MQPFMVWSAGPPTLAFRLCRAALVFFAAGWLLPARGDTIIDFEGLPDSTIVTNQYPGLSFTNGIILSAGISLNEFEFPPHSGVNVVSDNGGPISIEFASPVLSFGGFFTYLEPLTIEGFNASDIQIATAKSAFSTNDALFGDLGSSPNEFLDVTAASGISSITITADPAGFSFTLDDAMISRPTPVPEPETVLLLLISVVGLLAFRKTFTT